MSHRDQNTTRMRGWRIPADGSCRHVCALWGRRSIQRHDLPAVGRCSSPVARRGLDNGRLHRDNRRRDAGARGVRLVAIAVYIRWYTFQFRTLGWIMSDWQPTPYRNYQWIVADPQLLGGKLAIRGTRLSVSLILECLAAGMSLEDIDQAFDRVFPHEAMPEVLKVAAELTNSIHVAA